MARRGLDEALWFSAPQKASGHICDGQDAVVSTSFPADSRRCRNRGGPLDTGISRVRLGQGIFRNGFFGQALSSGCAGVRSRSAGSCNCKLQSLSLLDAMLQRGRFFLCQSVDSRFRNLSVGIFLNPSAVLVWYNTLPLIFYHR